MTEGRWPEDGGPKTGEDREAPAARGSDEQGGDEKEAHRRVSTQAWESVARAKQAGEHVKRTAHNDRAAPKWAGIGRRHGYRQAVPAVSAVADKRPAVMG